MRTKGLYFLLSALSDSFLMSIPRKVLSDCFCASVKSFPGMSPTKSSTGIWIQRSSTWATVVSLHDSDLRGESPSFCVFASTAILATAGDPGAPFLYFPDLLGSRGGGVVYRRANLTPRGTPESELSSASVTRSWLTRIEGMKSSSILSGSRSGGRGPVRLSGWVDAKSSAVSKDGLPRPVRGRLLREPRSRLVALEFRDMVGEVRN